MIKLLRDRKSHEYEEVESLKQAINNLVAKINDDDDFVLKSEYYFVHFFENKIEEQNTFFLTNQVPYYPLPIRSMPPPNICTGWWSSAIACWSICTEESEPIKTTTFPS